MGGNIVGHAHWLFWDGNLVFVVSWVAPLGGDRGEAEAKVNRSVKYGGIWWNLMEIDGI